MIHHAGFGPLNLDAIWNEANLGAQRTCQRGGQDLTRFMYQSPAALDSPIDNCTSGMLGSTGVNQRAGGQQYSFSDISDWSQLSPSLDGSFFGTASSEFDIGT